MRLLVVALALALMCGCMQVQNSCTTPYILAGGGCCLDENDDGICDKDQQVPTTVTTSTTSSTTHQTTSTTVRKIRLYSPEIVGYYRKDMELRNLTCYLNTTACINNACRTFMRIVDCNYTEKDILKGMMYSVIGTSTTATTSTTIPASPGQVVRKVVYTHQIIGYVQLSNTTCYFNTTACINYDCRTLIKTVSCDHNYTEREMIRTMMEEL